MSATWTLTLPVAAGTIGQFLLDSSGSGAGAWRYQEKTLAKTANYTATGDETVITCDSTSAAFTITLPPAASFANKHYYIKKTSSDFNAVTIDGNASETIDGQTTTTINTQYETIKIVCDGLNWFILDRSFLLGQQAYTPTFSNLGTATNVSFSWWREGVFLAVQGYFTAGTGTGSAAAISIPSGPTVSQSYTSIGFVSSGANNVGDIASGSASATSNDLKIIVDPSLSTTVVNIGIKVDATTSNLDKIAGSSLNGATFSIKFKVPISGWKAA